MEIKGKVVAVLPMESGTSKAGNAWSKASIIIETTDNPQSPKKVKLSNMKKAEEFARLAVGTEAVFSIEIDSHEYNQRWYTEVICWRWDIPQTITAAMPQAQPQGVPYQQYIGQGAPQVIPQMQAPQPQPYYNTQAIPTQQDQGVVQVGDDTLPF